ncbi:hypothetical protein C7448_10519 [Tenacibaculum gallaicum]|uniref:Uncharacterized protein n=1 Tax=Tenacibaculum gallaicum TaxID=561505 RepID=A0A3E0HQ91_9FLAO|nr:MULTISPECIES: hypothetical protein [Tenacibaculum]MDO6676808.1 hypothetical protein [Tenacibaculum sp. 1_MG-2023]MDX8554154.1 hypothetical protein [Tenacibaculum sp. 1B UA]REH48743.1 hypothetical protein C7448_10519 [Tenacibaculum gallaicum]
MKLKNLLIVAFLFLSFQLFSQNSQQTIPTKENICKGAAISVVANVKPFVERGFPKSEIIEIGKELVKDVIKDSPAKAYDLLKDKKSSEEVTKVLYNDFMKLDDKVVSKFLLKPQPDDDY